MAQKQQNPVPKIPEVERYGPPSTNPLARSLAAKWNAKQMLTPNRNGGLKLPDEIGSRPAPTYSLSKFNPKILGGSRKNYALWLLNQRYPPTGFHGYSVSGIPSA